MKTISKIKIRNFTAVFEPDKKSGGFTVTIPALPGCISEGDSFEEAKKNIEEAAALYLETVKETDENSNIQSNFVIAPIEVRV